MVLRGEPGARHAFINKWRELASFFRITLDMTSTHEVNMLDVKIFKGPKWQRTGCLDTSLYTKPTSLNVPLSSSSHHPHNIHKNWPIGRVRKFSDLCATEEDFASAKQKFVSLQRKSSPLHPAIEPVLDYPWRSDRIHSIFRTPCEECSWLFLPFHRLLARVGLTSTLKKLWDKWRPILERACLIGRPLMPRISWSLSGKPHLSIVASGHGSSI